MPQAIKIGAQHLLITLFIAPLSVLFFTNIMGEMSESHDNGIKLDYVVGTVAEIKGAMDTNLPKLRTVSTRVRVLEVEMAHLKDEKDDSQ